MHVNIEYAHIYGDQSPAEEQQRATECVKRLIKGINKDDSFCLTVLIDEYHPQQQSLLLHDYIDFLDSHGVRPHYVVLESDLRKLAYKVLYSIPADERKSLCRWMNKKDAFPCSLLTATWYLVRLNMFGSIPMIEIGSLLNGAQRFFGDHLITVLPKSYMENEKRAVEMIAASPWKFLVDRIGWEWI